MGMSRKQNKQTKKPENKTKKKKNNNFFKSTIEKQLTNNTLLYKNRSREL